MGVRARDPLEGEELNPELSVPPSPLLPRGPERHTYTWPCQSRLGGLPAWPSMGSFHCGERRRGDGGPGNRTLRPLWQDLTRAGLTRKLPLGTAPAPQSWAPDCRPVPPLLLPRARGLSPSPAPPRASTGSFLTLPWDPWSIYSPQLTPTHAPGASSFPPLPHPVLPCPLFIYWAGGGVRAQAEEIPRVLGWGGVTVTMVCPPSPGWG